MFQFNAMGFTGTYFDELTAPGYFVIIYYSRSLLAVPLIAYGILRAQLFDIDLRIRRTIKQSTLATTVVTFIFLFSEGADRFLSAELGNVAGLLAAADPAPIAPVLRFGYRSRLQLTATSNGQCNT